MSTTSSHRIAQPALHDLRVRDLGQHARLKPARVTVTLTDRRQITRLRESARSDFQEPYREDEVRAKFRELAGVVLGRLH